MQRMFNLRKWSELRDGGALSYKSVRARIVKFDINCATEVSLHLRYPEGAYATRAASDIAESAAVDEIIAPGTTFFLALVKGRETIETFVDGQVELLAVGGNCYVYTADGDDVSSVVLEPVIFTRIAERKARNPELEAIERRMYLNQEKRLQQQMADMDRRYGRLLSAAEERVHHAERKSRERPTAEAAAAAEAGLGASVDKQASDKDAGSGSDDKATGGKAAAAPDAKKGSGKG